MKQIAILGSTGSIGKSALEVIRSFPDKFKVTALSTNSNIELLREQIKEFRPKCVAVKDLQAALKLKKTVGSKCRIFTGESGLVEVAKDKVSDGVLLAISGSAALKPLLAAIDEKKDIALANKEALVMAGAIVMERAFKRQVKILPIDSEQSAIWQCLNHQEPRQLKNIYLTASGGPFINLTKNQLRRVSIDKVLKHPRWKMGKKITVDSATLMNKGLEVLEALALFSVSLDKIKVIVHPQAVIHSMVEFIDGVILAQLSVTDMRIPIQYALSYPERLPSELKGLDFYKLRQLNFQAPDCAKFPCLKLAYQAALDGGTAPAVLNASNEVSVEEFLKGNLNFVSIPKIVEKVLARHQNKKSPTLNEIFEADLWARNQAIRVVAGLGSRRVDV